MSPDELLSLDLPCDEEAPAAVRAALSEQDRLGWIMGDAIFVASELVTNAVLHSGAGAGHILHVTATLDGACVRICVDDPLVPGQSVTPLQITEVSDAGIGMLVVDQLASRWGAERDGGYRVWAELALLEA